MILQCFYIFSEEFDLEWFYVFFFTLLVFYICYASFFDLPADISQHWYSCLNLVSSFSKLQSPWLLGILISLQYSPQFLPLFHIIIFFATFFVRLLRLKTRFNIYWAVFSRFSMHVFRHKPFIFYLYTIFCISAERCFCTLLFLELLTSSFYKQNKALKSSLFF